MKQLSLCPYLLLALVNIASPLVGSGPRVKTFIPPETSPDIKAGSKV